MLPQTALNIYILKNLWHILWKIAFSFNSQFFSSSQQAFNICSPTLKYDIKSVNKNRNLGSGDGEPPHLKTFYNCFHFIKLRTNKWTPDILFGYNISFHLLFYCNIRESIVFCTIIFSYDVYSDHKSSNNSCASLLRHHMKTNSYRVNNENEMKLYL